MSSRYCSFKTTYSSKPTSLPMVSTFIIARAAFDALNPSPSIKQRNNRSTNPSQGSRLKRAIIHLTDPLRIFGPVDGVGFPADRINEINNGGKVIPRADALVICGYYEEARKGATKEELEVITADLLQYLDLTETIYKFNKRTKNAHKESVGLCKPDEPLPKSLGDDPSKALEDDMHLEYRGYLDNSFVQNGDPKNVEIFLELRPESDFEEEMNQAVKGLTLEQDNIPLLAKECHVGEN
ncbi:hypothetical protein DL96DRAFT_1609935 [Flagelloscypha sp. PMI_526]|nr:hypothetical protein DL96DRAFT_1609935 [Flagelloscypha sp. PMI_526]